MQNKCAQACWSNTCPRNCGKQNAAVHKAPQTAQWCNVHETHSTLPSCLITHSYAGKRPTCLFPTYYTLSKRNVGWQRYLNQTVAFQTWLLHFSFLFLLLTPIAANQQWFKNKKQNKCLHLKQNMIFSSLIIDVFLVLGNVHYRLGYARVVVLGVPILPPLSTIQRSETVLTTTRKNSCSGALEEQLRSISDSFACSYHTVI